jgi:hypothetical protein
MGETDRSRRRLTGRGGTLGRLEGGVLTGGRGDLDGRGGMIGAVWTVDMVE